MKIIKNKATSIYRYIRRIISNSIQLLCCPVQWVNIIIKHRNSAISILIMYMMMGVFINSHYTFPHFCLFTSLFMAIGTIVFLCLYYFSKQLPKLVNVLAIQPGARSANVFYYKWVKKTSLYIVVPVAIVLIFGIGGCKMFGALKITPTLYWILCLFSIVVYISIVGYLQYVFLFLYVIKLANSKDIYTNIQHDLAEYIPAELEWLQDLTKLCHIYRSVFFTLGSIYIVAFGLFCFLPKMATNINTPWFFILWGIISIAIVIVFPITTLIEQKKTKSIILRLKKTYVRDLVNELNSKSSMNETSLETSQRRFFETMYTAQIMNSKDYPIQSLGNAIYTISLTILNMATSLITVIQGLSTFLVDFPHMS